MQAEATTPEPEHSENFSATICAITELTQAELLKRAKVVKDQREKMRLLSAHEVVSKELRQFFG